MSTTAEYVAKFPRRKKLWETVEKYWLEDARRPPGSLDSSLKKHTTLLNRLKSSLLVGPAETLIKEIDGLTLTKYLEEIVAAVVEGSNKKGDSEIAVDIIVHLHTRLTPDFLPLLLQPLLSILSSPTTSNAPASKDAEKDKEKEDKERLGRQRPVLRIVAELAMIGAWAEGQTKGASEVGKVLKGFMTGDTQYTNLPLLTTFLKYFVRAYLGPTPIPIKNGQSNGDSAEKEQLLEDVTELIPVEVQKKMRELFENYFNTASKTLVKGQIRLLEQDRRNHEAYIKSGEIFEDRQQAYEKMTKAVERLTTGVTTLADLLGLQAPTLPTAASLAKSGLQIVESASSFTVREDGPISGGIWDDEEERRFYEDLVDLREVVPSGLLGIKESKPANGNTSTTEEVIDGKEEEEKQKADEEDLRRQLEQMELQPDTNDQPSTSEPQAQEMSRTVSTSTSGEGNTQEPRVAEDDEPAVQDTSVIEDDGLQSGPAARLTALFAALPEANNREVVDKLAVEFAFLNSKAARKRLIKFIGEVPKQRTDLLPHYARFVATLDRYMPDIGTGVLQILDEEMRYLQRKRLVRELDSLRLKNVRFYGELAKFKVAKPYTILHVLKVFLDEFKFNIENISNLLENCGRFLLRFEGTKETAKKMVELMRRKQGNSHLDQRHQVMLENAFYMCNPPERVAREVIILSPMQSFIQHLFHDILMKRTLDKVLKLLRKLHWEDAETYEFILSSFASPNDIKFGNIPYLAALVYDLQRYHPEFSIAVVDQVMEDIRIGMEENIFKHNQRRIATIRYLGELYMYRVVGAGVIFETLWGLLSFGHSDPFPIPGRESPIDAVDDFFRVRLACTLLDTCGACFDKGSQARKLDQYLVMLQLYVACKAELPMDVDFMLTDTLDTLRPKMPHLRTFNEAAAKVDEILALGAGEDDESDSEGSEEGDRNVPEDPLESNEAEVIPAPNENNEEEEEDNVVLIRKEETEKHSEMDEQAQSEFDREFAKLLADTTDARRDQRKNAPPVFDTAVPLIRKKHEEKEVAAGQGGEGKMQFMLLSKKGNRQQIRSLNIPMDSTIALNSKSHQAQSNAEREQLKRLVLQNERRLERAEVQDIETRGIKLRYLPS
ncbi:hypothetical protein I302_101565 [Kwoniella bestiolae CBS 10118]|uniref:MIF4G domain-containing protein n=1 Tax=Kwoniella bestiolae CBS 10118 TaxID=1296100 RepID=A0A1B9GCL1_9TREE|nr:hypothetical protein I302_00248 [Kwoniella bestiolae CBS 10118]OCF28759.1 hypothetical protein I302_00248 [Kwoniella bestiolae CBS 10118]